MMRRYFKNLDDAAALPAVCGGIQASAHRPIRARNSLAVHPIIPMGRMTFGASNTHALLTNL
jgi:hypothetical protein